MMRFLYAALCCTLIVVFVPEPVAAQTTLSGVVRDRSLRPIPGATVRSGLHQVVTNGEGRFELSGLSEDEPRLEIRAPGFLTLQLAARPGDLLEIVLEIAPVTTMLTVVADTSPETGRVAGGSAVVPEREILESNAHHLKDVLLFVPGVHAQSRFGADESQLSIRGSGLRNNFHLRGVNILINGIPYQDADGFSDFESVDLFATERIQVWKGANALQYGGSSMGGAINLVTYDALSSKPIVVRALAGSFGLFKWQVAGGGARHPLAWFASLSRTDQEGFRQYSQQERTRFFGNADLHLRPRSTLRLDLIYADVADELPGALTAEEFRRHPERADPHNVANRWARDYDYIRLAAQVLHLASDNQELSGYLFGQRRSMSHPIFQILEQEADNGGGEINLRLRQLWLGRENRFVAGLTHLRGSNVEHRYENAAGNRGAEVADFVARARSWALYLENQFQATSRLTINAGGRLDSAERIFQDRFPRDGDRSDDRVFRSFSPRIGVLWGAGSHWQGFANASRSYEPPLLLELTSFGAPGFLDLEAQSTRQYEVGTRGSWSSGKRWDIAAYQADIDHQIINVSVPPFPGAPFVIPSYRNVEKTRHRGVEAGLALSFGTPLSLRLAWTLNDFRFVDDPQYGDNKLPGAPDQIVRSEARYQAARWWIAPTADWSPSPYFTNSENTLQNDSYLVLHVRAGIRFQAAEFFAEWSNVTDEQYAPSVQVDAANGRTYEPGAPRSISLGLRWAGGHP